MEESASSSERAIELLTAIQRQQLATTQRLDLLAGDIDEVRSARQPPPPPPNPEDSEQRLTNIERAVKWASPWRNLLVLLGFFVVGAVGVVTSLRSLAEEAVIETVSEAHAGEHPQIEPSVKTVSELQRDVGAVKGGVDCLVAEKRKAQDMRAIELELDLHKQQYDELLQAWSANKAARRNAGEKPQKSPRHLQLEASLKALAGQKLCDSEEETQ